MNTEEGKKKSFVESIWAFIKEVLKLMVTSAAVAMVQVGITNAFMSSPQVSAA